MLDEAEAETHQHIQNSSPTLVLPLEKLFILSQQENDSGGLEGICIFHFLSSGRTSDVIPL